MNAVSDRLDRVGAMSAAMNQVQPHLMPDDNRRSRLALGMGFYRGHGALALGYDYTCRQGDRGARASFALSDRGDVMGGAGVVFGW
jgi:autotransporter adhesin